MPIPVTNRPIKNEAQRLLIARKVPISELAAVTCSSRAAAGYWLQGHTLPATAARSAVEARWPEVRADLWDTLPATMRRAPKEVDASDARAPAGVESPVEDEDHGGEMRRHLKSVERQIDATLEAGRIGEWVKLGTLKQKILLDLAKHSGQLGPIAPSGLTRTDQFLKIRALLLDALVPFPEAHRSVQEALEAIGA